MSLAQQFIKHPSLFNIASATGIRKAYLKSTFMPAKKGAVYEEDVQEFMKSVLKKGDVVIDCGANVGIFSLLASRLVAEKGKVYSFEPAFHAFKILKKKASSHRNIIPINLALSDRQEQRMLNIGIEGTSEGNSFLNSSELSNKELVKTTTLDEYFKNHTRKTKLIKIDVEGLEAEIIRGGSKLIKRDRPYICFESFMDVLYMKDRKYEQVFDLLKSLGYRRFKELDTNTIIHSFSEQIHFLRNVVALPGE